MKKEIKEVVIKQAKEKFGSFTKYAKCVNRTPQNGDAFAIGIIEKCIKYLKPLGLVLGKKELIFTHIKKGDEWIKLEIMPYKFYDVKHIKDDVFECTIKFQNDEIDIFTLKGNYELKEVF